MSGHTPTPWKFVPWHIAEGPSEVRAPAGWLICTMSSDDDAKHLTDCVNSHAALVAERDALLAIVTDACEVLRHYDLPEHAFHYERVLAGKVPLSPPPTSGRACDGEDPS